MRKQRPFPDEIRKTSGGGFRGLPDMHTRKSKCHGYQDPGSARTDHPEQEKKAGCRAKSNRR